MKREGRQHGTIRITRNSKLLKTAAAADAEAATAAAAEPFAVTVAATAEKAKAGGKPTNASRSTGKCRRPRCAGCHTHPVTKAKDKAKGSHKLRSCDVALNHRLVSWRVVDHDGGSGVPEYRGKSASSLLAYLAGGSGNSWHEEDDDVDVGSGIGAPDAGLSDLYDLFVGGRRVDAEDGGEEDGPADLTARGTDVDGVGAEIQAIGEQGLLLDDKEDGDEEEEEDMGFCMVGITIAVEFSDGEEDWIVVEEI